MNKGLRIAMVAAVIFSSGIAAGHSLSGLRSKAMRRQGLSRVDSDRTGEAHGSGPMAHRLEFLRRAQRELDLTSEQRSRVQAHLDASHERLRKMWEPMAPEFRAEVESVKERIRGEMTSTQREHLDRIIKGRNRRIPMTGRQAERLPGP